MNTVGKLSRISQMTIYSVAPENYRSAMAKQDVIVVHGGSCWASYTEYLNELKKTKFKPGASPSNNWQQSLQVGLGPRFRILLPEMPNWQNAKYQEWKIWFANICEASDDSPLVVGHSLGSIFLVRYYSESKTLKGIKKLFLVSTPYATMSENPDFGDFAFKRAPTNLRKQAERITFYHSKDDRIVPFENIDKYKSIFPDAHYHIFEHQGHFIQKSFPELVRDLKAT